MAIAEITGQGLKTIAFLVALLWVCVIAEHVMVTKANREALQAMRDIHTLQMRRRAQPVSVPARRMPPRPMQPTIG